ncbi:calmodulin [Lotmaria passim]
MEDLSDTELQEFKEIFDLVDADHSGVISLQELRKLMATLHLRPTEQELTELFEEAHASPAPATAPAAAAAAPSLNNSNSAGSGGGASAVGGSADRTINFTQFASIMARRVQSEYSAEQLRGAFQLFESPDMPEGFVSTQVLAHALRTYGSQKPSEAEVERLIAAVDPEHTGRLNYYDFVDLVSK